MKHYTIKINNNSNKNTFRNNNASKSLDDLILSNLIKMNPYLKTIRNNDTLDAMFTEAGFNDNDRIIISNRDNSNLLKGNFDTEFAKAARFLANYNPSKKIYTFDKNDITFFEDEIQIGTTLIPLYKLTDIRYYNDFTPAIKNIIINLFITIKG